MASNASDYIRSLKPDTSSVRRAEALASARVAAAGADPSEDESVGLLRAIRQRKESVQAEQLRLRTLHDRMDNLYNPQAITEGGADHWPLADPQPGTVHVSVNTPPAYVTIPSSLESAPPVENYVAESGGESEQEAAARRERLYFAWKDAIGFELAGHKACITKRLYGYTFGKVGWDAVEKQPTVTVLETPSNLYPGWGASDYSRMDWAIYCYGLSPEAIAEEYGLEVGAIDAGNGTFVPYVLAKHDDPLQTIYGAIGGIRAVRVSDYEKNQVEVYDYWYKVPTSKGKKPEIWNAIFVGNELVENAKHPEFDDIPYLPLPNGFVPGSPYGKPDLYDLEQLFVEKDERISNAGAMLNGVVQGQQWQLVGSEAPEDVPQAAIPKPNKVAAPGPNAEIKAIQPFVPEFAINDYLKRIDDELETASGLNPVILGKIPAQVLSSSKALAAVVAQYIVRLRMHRDLYYKWRCDIWRMAAKVWERKDRNVKAILDGHYRLAVTPPELTPRDEQETAQRAIALLQNRVWSLSRAQDATGVDDPEGETEQIKREQTDPALNPAAVQAQVTLMSALQSFGGAPTPEQNANTQRTLNRPAPGSASLNQPSDQATPPSESMPANALAGNGAKAQTLVQGGEASGRVLSSVAL